MGLGSDLDEISQALLARAPSLLALVPAARPGRAEDLVQLVAQAGAADRMEGAQQADLAPERDHGRPQGQGRLGPAHRARPGLCRRLHLLAPGAKTKPQFWADDRIFWYIASGQVRFHIEGQEPIVASKGWLVQVPYRNVYWMETVGDEPSVRLEVIRSNRTPLYPASPGRCRPGAHRQGQDLCPGQLSHPAGQV